MKINTACFTGNRIQRLPFIFNENNKESNLIKQRLEEEIKKALANGYNHFISTIQLGIDMWAAEIVLRIKKFYPEVILEASLPYENQANFWTESQREQYFNILSKCDYINYTSTRYTASCSKLASIYMIDKSSLLIAVYDENDKETMAIIDYAENKGLSLVKISINENKC